LVNFTNILLNVTNRVSVTWNFPHRRFPARNVSQQNVSCHKTFPVTKRFLSQNVACHKTLPTQMFSEQIISPTKCFLPQNVSPHKISTTKRFLTLNFQHKTFHTTNLDVHVSCYKMFPVTKYELLKVVSTKWLFLQFNQYVGWCRF